LNARKEAKLPPAKEKNAAPGLRARKREATRERLSRTAMALFLQHGFEATTVDDIAAAADVSRRSFFHYFASKEDVVFAWQEDSVAALVAAIAARPAGESMLEAAENAIIEIARKLDAREAIAIARLKSDNPALQARDEVKYQKLERAMAEALGKRAGQGRDRLRARLVAMIATGVMRIGADLWAAEGGREKPEALAKRTFAAIRAIFT
jgi:AcrR family transcriptional regulator